MMPRNKPWESYRKVATQTASPGQLVLMLYDGAIGFSEKALVGFSHSDPALFNQTISNNVLRAQAIIHEMNASLNMRDGGEVASNFRRLYNYLYRRLRDANRSKKKEPIEETIKHLRVLRESWAEMLRNGGEARYLEEVQQAQQAAAA
ncbi:MAG TPA: flagellar export chaperone FliS [Verrucomicrobiae bacterium]|nr:flagellar export chaperone FliS [Verrucomicrobiae bacterium]